MRKANRSCSRVCPRISKNTLFSVVFFQNIYRHEHLHVSAVVNQFIGTLIKMVHRIASINGPLMGII